MWRADSLEKALMMGMIEGRRKRGWQRMRCLNSIINSMNMSLSKLQEIMKDRETRQAAVHGVTKSWTLLREWTTIKFSHVAKFLNIQLYSHFPDSTWVNLVYIQCITECQKIILNVIELGTKFGSIIFPIFLIKTIKKSCLKNYKLYFLGGYYGVVLFFF